MFTKEFWLAALKRGIRTFAESILSFIGGSAIVLSDVNWIGSLSAGALGFVVSVLLAVATGIPEAPKKENE